MNTSLGLVGGSGSAAPDVKFVRSAANTWQIATTAGGAAILDMNGGQIIHTYLGTINNGRMYGITASPYADTTSAGVTSIFFGPAAGGGVITLQDTSVNQLTTQTFSQISLSTTLADGLYDLYIKSASSTTISASTGAWSSTTAPPTRGTDIIGRATKNGDAGSLLVGAFRVVSNTVYDYTARRNIHNLFNQVSKRFAGTPGTQGPTGVVFPAAIGTFGVGIAEYIQTLSTGPGSAEFTFISSIQLSAINVIGGIGIGINATTATSLAIYQAYAATTQTTVACGLSPSPAAGLTTINFLLGVVGGGGNETLNSNNWYGTIQC